ncbi:putative claudin-24 [Plectropomus leopardus]|uniref:putative claudin-24 n=1 Tax=Plectropomus leopardus TaxID=160734 RepID=UPI001C4D5E8D|nr:putative claudin-24 [Plectropomus leopardus]
MRETKCVLTCVCVAAPPVSSRGRQDTCSSQRTPSHLKPSADRRPRSPLNDAVVSSSGQSLSPPRQRGGGLPLRELLCEDSELAAGAGCPPEEQRGAPASRRRGGEDAQSGRRLGAVMDPGAHALELSGVLVCGAAWLCSLATTLMSTWLTLSTDLLPTESYELGLWETCVVQDLGTIECRPYDGLLGLPPDIKLARILMCVTLAAGLLGLLLAIPGMRTVNSCHDRLDKRALKMAAGALCLAAGVLGLVPVSYIAHMAVLRFFDETVPEMVPRWEFGDALFCGWTAGVLHLAAGTLLLASCLCLQKDRCNAHVHVPLVRVRTPPGGPHIRTKTEYV